MLIPDHLHPSSTLPIHKGCDPVGRNLTLMIIRFVVFIRRHTLAREVVGVAKATIVYSTKGVSNRLPCLTIRRSWGFVKRGGVRKRTIEYAKDDSGAEASEPALCGPLAIPLVVTGEIYVFRPEWQ